MWLNNYPAHTSTVPSQGLRGLLNPSQQSVGEGREFTPHTLDIMVKYWHSGTHDQNDSNPYCWPSVNSSKNIEYAEVGEAWLCLIVEK